MSRGDGFDTIYLEVGERLAEARRVAGLSQTALAGKVALTRTSIVNIEHGRQRVPLHVLWRLANALDCDLRTLIPSQSELAARGAPVQLDANVVSYIEQVALDDPATKRLLTDFIQRATSTLDGKGAKPKEPASSEASQSRRRIASVADT